MEVTLQTSIDKPLITNRILADLAAANTRATLGEWDTPSRTLLAVAIPEMATELLLRRARNDASAPSPPNQRHQINAAQSLSSARDIVRAAPPLRPGELAIACRTILQHSQNASERSAASSVLLRMREVAA